MAEKSKILIVGGTGYLGRFVVLASAQAGNPTFALVRDTAPSDPQKAKLLDSFKNAGVTLVKGDLDNHESLVEAIKQVDVVISTVGTNQIPDQVKIIAAIKEAGNVKRFLPSEFGNDAVRSNAVEPAKSTVFAAKVQIRRTLEAQGIPFTLICSNLFAGFFIPTLGQPGASVPPRDKVVILGDGYARAVIVKEEDIGAYTIKAADDPRTLNKIVYIKPPGDIYSFNELVALWENKIGKTLQKIYVPEEEILKNIEASDLAMGLILSVTHAIFVKGDQTNFELDPSFELEASELYPDVNYTSVDKYLSQFV
ncbi:phenylcoumaran benzylic ether reductase Betv6-like [Aristolochia californica]|uniref:phenylcoumaran benzylic ether reductase Betv6-like n=1 Tax=Aristolochia californica TaxID=171875 RepID=UPI0035DCA49E